MADDAPRDATPGSSERPHLISFDTCPFVERSRIALEAKGVEHDVTFISLRDKPSWFLDISPRGKVPVLLVRGRAIFESSVINELLEDLHPEPAMMPVEPLDRADARAWIAFANDVLMPALATIWFRARRPHKREQAQEVLESALDRLERRLSARDHDGRFFHGDTLGLVDTAYAPAFTRWPLLEPLGYPTTLLDARPQLAAYVRALLDDPSVQRAQTEGLVEKLSEALKLAEA